jgi:hypothetical protein
MLAEEGKYYAQRGRALLVDMVQSELADPVRLIYRGEHAVAFVPACARYPYEVWVMPIDPAPDFAALSCAQRADLSRALKTVLLKYEGLWQRPFPYLMAWYQAPTDGAAHPETQLHAQFLPPYRTRERLKYLAGTELGAGMFAMDALPEEKAAELQAVAIAPGTHGMTGQALSAAAFFEGRPYMQASAPGRVNLLGEHTDYNDGFMLPIATPQRTVVSVAAASGAESHYYSQTQNCLASFGIAEEAPPGFGRYVYGAVCACWRNAVCRSRHCACTSTAAYPWVPACRAAPRSRWRPCARCALC